ncbi:MAG: NADH-quinone oxidoreductase subunit J [Acidimicrobiia bacterium]|nr:NADH-quinone oxidoreductase subunit J [Acidimicrobiia bacterium]
MDLSIAQNWFFIIIALAMVMASLIVVTTRNVMHAALMLVGALAGSAALFVLLGAEFVAGVIVLVYIGAIIVLFLFGVMITRVEIGRSQSLDHERKWPAAVIAIGTFAVLAGSSVAFFGDEEIEGVAAVRTSDIGTAIFERFVVPFEVVSFVLLAALIGGIVLARRDDPES